MPGLLSQGDFLQDTPHSTLSLCSLSSLCFNHRHSQTQGVSPSRNRLAHTPFISAVQPAPPPPPPAPPAEEASELSDSEPPSDEEETLGESDEQLGVRLRALRNHPAYVRALSYQAAICSSLLRHLPTRIVWPEVVDRLAEALDFRLMPLEKGGDEALETWGDEALRWLASEALPHLEEGTLAAEALRVRLFVREHREEWMVKVDVFSRDGKKEGTEVRLALTGESSIACTLFEEPWRVPGGAPHQFLALLDFMIAFRYNQTDCERIGRTMSLTKTTLRTSLGDLHFSQAVWVAFNSPPIHQVDLVLYVRRWIASGHLSAVMRDREAERARQVLERKSDEKKRTFLR